MSVNFEFNLRPATLPLSARTLPCSSIHGNHIGDNKKQMFSHSHFHLEEFFLHILKPAFKVQMTLWLLFSIYLKRRLHMWPSNYLNIQAEFSVDFETKFCRNKHP